MKCFSFHLEYWKEIVRKTPNRWELAPWKEHLVLEKSYFYEFLENRGWAPTLKLSTFFSHKSLRNGNYVGICRPWLYFVKDNAKQVFALGRSSEKSDNWNRGLWNQIKFKNKVHPKCNENNIWKKLWRILRNW